MKALGAKIDTARGDIFLPRLGTMVPPQEARSGNYQLDLVRKETGTHVVHPEAETLSGP